MFEPDFLQFKEGRLDILLQLAKMAKSFKDTLQDIPAPTPSTLPTRYYKPIQIPPSPSASSSSSPSSSPDSEQKAVINMRDAIIRNLNEILAKFAAVKVRAASLESSTEIFNLLPMIRNLKKVNQLI